MHSLLATVLKTSPQNKNIVTVWNRIVEMQNTLLEHVKTADANVQTKVAELFLMGDRDEQK
jgi:hypothetical protein